MRRAILRALLIVSAAAPLVACNTVQSEVDGGTFAALSGTPTQAEPRTGRKTAAKAGPSKDAGRYFIEFRSRYALSYGHTFLVHGRLNAKGEIGELSEKNVAGFHPAGAGPELWMLGHVIPVQAETGPSDGDTEEEYVSARFRVYLSEAEYNHFLPKLKEKQASNAMWHAAGYNCNMWVGQLAEYIGLKAPLNHLQYPANYINEMRQLNTTPDRIAAVAPNVIPEPSVH